MWTATRLRKFSFKKFFNWLTIRSEVKRRIVVSQVAGCIRWWSKIILSINLLNNCLEIFLFPDFQPHFQNLMNCIFHEHNIYLVKLNFKESLFTVFQTIQDENQLTASTSIFILLSAEDRIWQMQNWTNENENEFFETREKVRELIYLFSKLYYDL